MFTTYNYGVEKTEEICNNYLSKQFDFDNLICLIIKFNKE
jgi:hypothetical protein